MGLGPQPPNKLFLKIEFYKCGGKIALNTIFCSTPPKINLKTINQIGEEHNTTNMLVLLKWENQIQSKS